MQILCTLNLWTNFLYTYKDRLPPILMHDRAYLCCAAFTLVSSRLKICNLVIKRKHTFFICAHALFIDISFPFFRTVLQICLQSDKLVLIRSLNFFFARCVQWGDGFGKANVMLETFELM